MKIPPPTQTQIIVEMIRNGTLDPSAICPVPLPSLPACLNELMGPSGLSSTEMAELASLHRSSVFRILSGETTPSRNVLLCLSFVLDLSYEEMQTLLKCGECATLSGARARDREIIKGRIEELSLGEMDDRLKSLGFQGLVKS